MSPPRYGKKNAALTADSMTVVVELNAVSSPAVREGLDLVAVLDVSGRMDKANKARMNTALKFVIKKLTPTDRLCIVTFADGATRHCPLRSMTAAAQRELRAIVDDAVEQTGGGSNIKAGMNTALAVLSSRNHTKGRTANVFLLSNGVQSTGGDARLVDVSSVAVFTFGIGRDTDNVVRTT
jgi:Mg-chelatase subunit ChlD